MAVFLLIMKEVFYIMKTIDIEKVLSSLTLEEKASLCSGMDFWHTQEIPRLDIPAVMVSDGPNGLRKEEVTDNLGVCGSVEAICFPTASAMACSFDRDLIHQVGEALGEECQAEGVSVLLGPGINMKRSPLCGRNFEYYSEDPYLAGELGAAFVNGVQSQHVGTSLKHFAANNQEKRRLTISSKVDERTLREIYLTAFEKTVKQAQPWTIMCSYNRINGVYSCENNWLLNDVLRGEWGYEGLMLTDWGAMNDRVPALKAGLDLEMPSSHGVRDQQIVKAVESGELSIEVLDQAVTRVLTLVNKSIEHQNEKTSYDKQKHHELARKVACESAVLLKNEKVLPIKKEQKVLIIGEFARNPRIQGGGSSHINCTQIDSALDALKHNPNIQFEQGYSLEDVSEEMELKMRADAMEAAMDVDVAVIFAGLPDSYESEGFDRTHIDLPEAQNKLIEAVSKAQANTVVVLHNGSPVTMPWLGRVRSVLEMYLAGEASGSAAVDLLYGKVNPSGKLAETFPLYLEDNPSYLTFPGNQQEVCYQEGVFIGYRYYDKKRMEVLFPFGHGLSYTDFDYENITLLVNDEPVATDQDHMPHIKDTDSLRVQMTLKNIGDVAGAEVVQLYVYNAPCEDARPLCELRGFQKVYLKPGKSKTITLELDKRAFSYYHTGLHDWYAPSGEYIIFLGSSSRDLRAPIWVSLESTAELPYVVDGTSSPADIRKHVKDTAPLDALLTKSGFSLAADTNDSMGDGTGQMLEAMFSDTPLHSILSFSETVTQEDIDEAIAALNRQ